MIALAGIAESDVTPPPSSNRIAIRGYFHGGSSEISAFI